MLFFFYIYFWLIMLLKSDWDKIAHLTNGGDMFPPSPL